jgi:hypothetical protein
MSLFSMLGQALAIAVSATESGTKATVRGAKTGVSEFRSAYQAQRAATKGPAPSAPAQVTTAVDIDVTAG